MSLKNHKSSAHLLGGMATASYRKPRVEFTDTDPQMLYAMWEMETGADPDASLQEVEGAVVVYDKFRPRISRRKV